MLKNKCSSCQILMLEGGEERGEEEREEEERKRIKNLLIIKSWSLLIL